MVVTLHELPPPPHQGRDELRHALPAPDQQQANQNRPRRPKTSTMLLIVAGIAVVLAILLIVTIVLRIHRNRVLAAAANEAATTPPKVYVIHPVRPEEADLSLAANTQAIEDAVIYARSSGYLLKRYVDLGDKVKQGELMAEIQAPEIDQQLRQAQADLQQSIKTLEQEKANLEFARVTLERYQAADKEGAVAKEDVDQRLTNYQTAQATVAAAEATVAANQANVARNQQLTEYERVTAPFDGTVVQRNVDIGSLITAGSPTNNTSVSPTNTSGAANGIFEVAQLGTLRVFVNVPQVFAPNVHQGLGAQVAVRGQLNRPVAATVTRTANALDPVTRTLLTEVDIPNSEHHLMPGMFVYVNFKIGPSGSRWRIPDTAMIFNALGTQVFIAGEGNKLHIQPVIVGRDFGNAIDIQSGIDGGEWLVKQPSVAMEEGEVIQPVQENESNDGKK